MKKQVELYHNTYRNYSEELYGAIRSETYGEDIGQTSWITADEYRRFFALLNLYPGEPVLEVASGSGGPAVFMVKETFCNLTGIDINEDGISNAQRLAAEHNLSRQTKFLVADASAKLPFENDMFDTIVSIDSINHLRDRAFALKEFYRVLRKGGRLLFTDAVVVTAF